MKIIGKVVDTFSAIIGTSGMPRPKVESLELIEEFGIKNDKFAGLDVNKSVMIVGIDTYDLAKEAGIELKYGSLGENILLDFNPHIYDIGTILSINVVKIEITEKCTICNHLSVFGKSLPKIVKDCRGLYCKVLSNGTISRENEVLKDI
jgi:MOSC domain-containing protein YiiM